MLRAFFIYNTTTVVTIFTFRHVFTLAFIFFFITSPFHATYFAAAFATLKMAIARLRLYMLPLIFTQLPPQRHAMRATSLSPLLSLLMIFSLLIRLMFRLPDFQDARVATPFFAASRYY